MQITEKLLEVQALEWPGLPNVLERPPGYIQKTTLQEARLAWQAGAVIKR